VQDALLDGFRSVVGPANVLTGVALGPWVVESANPPDTLISASPSRIERTSRAKPAGTRNVTSIVPRSDWPVSATTGAETAAADAASTSDQEPGIRTTVRSPVAKAPSVTV